MKLVLEVGGDRPLQFSSKLHFHSINILEVIAKNEF